MLRSRQYTTLLALCFGAAAFLAPGSVEAQPQRWTHQHPAMGVSFSYILYCEDAELAARLFSAAEKRVAALEQALSDYREQSEVNQLCRSAPQAAPQQVSVDLFRVTARAEEFSRLTHGAFDITVGPASQLWRKAIKRRRLPNTEQIEELRHAIGYESIRISPPDQLQLLKANMQLDFGGIAQGDAADQIAQLFREAGITSALIDVSGDILAVGAPPGEPGWRIELPGVGTEPPALLCLKDSAVTTSGDRQQRLVIDGIRYSHIVDPRTGRAVQQSLQATVIAPDATTADALASALCVLPPDEGLELVETLEQVEARLNLPISSDREASEKPPPFRESSGFERFVRASDSPWDR